MKIKPLYGKFGMEPTYYPTYIKHIHPFWNEPLYGESDGAYEGFITPAVDAMDNLMGNTTHPWAHEFHNDEECLECSTPVYSDRKEFEKHWVSALKILNAHGFVESSKVCMDAEGGCHLSFDMEAMFDNFISKVKGPNEAKELCERFMKNFLIFIRNNPSIVWAFLSPYDNESAEITFDSANPSNLTKGHFLNASRTSKSIPGQDLPDSHRFGGSTHWEYYYRMELRFFMMPRSFSEMKFHLDFGNHLMHYIHDLTFNKEIVLVDINNIYKIIKYTFPKALTNLRKVSKEIGIDPRLFAEFGKIKLMKQRFGFAKKNPAFLLNQDI